MSARELSDLDPLVASLLARAPKMNFMQLCRLLELRIPGAPRPEERPFEGEALSGGLPGFGTRDTAEHEPVRFRPHPRMGFPAGEVTSVESGDGAGAFGHAFGPDAPPTVRTTFMGLYGVDATMPPHMIDEIVLREEGHEAVEAFLDQFNHRFVTLLYRAWKKYRYPESFRPGGTDTHSRNLLCLAGFGWGDKPQRAGLPDSRMLALLGLLIQRTRTPEGLAGVVALAVPGAAVRVDEFFPAITRAGQPRPLRSVGSAAAAETRGRQGLGGGGYVFGQRITYRSRAVLVTLRAVDAGQAHDLLPGAWLHRELMALVRLYVGVKADVHLRMEISSRLAPQPAIGQVGAGPAPRLGWTTVLPAHEERLIDIALGVYEAFPAPAPNPHLTPRHV
ncbi:type VI secretion system baseplate subunit TssG [Burkholderia multivorans]|uniref:type VI secretion system baseplate subunit TssG n=1 Tax=Burkholderia multivorans TaxID=87883 RepID=UPI001906F9F8|nr:type VI secretion system baseplate subunit TssG [Burkholderia multivorans]MBJ9941717.1 type VI secretion system baseplate subunit TssG [Burkholderia multivorans]MBU9286872.1 type VI secretion system baseplate subunit TssG [Burkholderia multivorans]